MSRQYDITQSEVEAALVAVQRAGGGMGYDGQSIADVKADKENQLYKIWNRMSSGSYMAQPVLLVDIPKAKGGVRQLGIPTVTDRIAQTVIKRRLESVASQHFHEDSYAYQAGKGAIDALAVARERCMRHEWLLELDIKGFFDQLDHEKLLVMVEKYVTDPATLLYVKRFLKASGRTNDGEEVAREKGTPQGGVVSPVLANLYLHEVFDAWMQERHPNLKWERYADDIVVHCVSENQAHYIRNRISGRMAMYNLELHPEKTRVVYTGTKNDHNKRGHSLPRKFTFLGYEFKPRNYKGRTVFTPGIGASALKMIRQKIKQKWKLCKRTGSSLEAIAASVNAVIRGWITYYGHYRRSELYRLGRILDIELAKFIKRKLSSGPGRWNRAWRELESRKRKQPRLFCHWYMISRKIRGAV